VGITDCQFAFSPTHVIEQLLIFKQGQLKSKKQNVHESENVPQANIMETSTQFSRKKDSNALDGGDEV